MTAAISTSTTLYGLGFDGRNFKVLSHIRGNAIWDVEVEHTDSLPTDGVVVVYHEGIDQLLAIIKERGNVPENIVLYGVKDAESLPSELRDIKRFNGDVFGLWGFLAQNFRSTLSRR